MLWTAIRLARGAPKTMKAPLVNLPKSAKIYPFGAAQLEDKEAILRFPKKGLTIRDGGEEGWAIVGDAEGRRAVVETLLGRHRITPNVPPPGPLPVNSSRAPIGATDPEGWTAARYVAFARPSDTGEFTDFTARYGALQEEDKLPLREKLIAFFDNQDQAGKNVDSALTRVELNHMKDIPAIALSSGQTRRMRIALALMTNPNLLILEDPMAGLDAVSRITVSELLSDVNATQDNPRVVLVLRGKGDETLADWVTNVCEVQNGNVWIGTKEEWETRQRKQSSPLNGKKAAGEFPSPTAASGNSEPPIARLRNVSVTYGEGERRVLDGVDWTIRPGDRWHLKGSNGSGKTTLLSVLLGHHPQSYSLPASALQLFSQPRRLVPTPILRQLMGHTSPEVYAAFPRNMGLTALDAIGTGYEGVFSRRPLSDDQKTRVLYLLEYFKDQLATSRTGTPVAMSVEDLALKNFAHYMPPQQALLIFLRAIVSRSPLLVLDEPTQGMDESIWAKCTELLDKEWNEMSAEGKDQACVVVSHYEDEIPWKYGKVLELVDGRVV